jgi:Cu/Ag efflux protein CusF
MMKSLFLSASLALALSIGLSTAASAQMSHADHQMDQAPAMIMAQGKVNSVNTADKTLNITHDPIEALGWPTMTMDFAVNPVIDLSKIQPGQPITFGLAKGTDGIYMVDHVMN